MKTGRNQAGTSRRKGHGMIGLSELSINRATKEEPDISIT
jgi:hypothetical protein